MTNNSKVRDVRSLACELKVLNGNVPGTWKFIIEFVELLNHIYTTKRIG